MIAKTPSVLEPVAHALAQATSTPMFRFEVGHAAADEPETAAQRPVDRLDRDSLVAHCLGSFLTGRWEEAQASAVAGVARPHDRADRIPAWPFQLCGALVAAGRGADDLTRGTLADDLATFAPAPEAHVIRQYVRHVRALAAIGRGDVESAYQEAAAMTRAGALHSAEGQALWVSMDLVEAAVRTNRRSEAAAHVTAMREANVAALSPRMALIEAGSAAMAAPDPISVDLFEDAIAIPHAERWPFELARVRLAYGERLRRSRAITESRTHLAAALEVFQGIGARPWTTRAAIELRAAGDTISSTNVRATPVLTPQEHQTALLAATGLTNKEIAERLFLSPRTVGAHLYRVFPKLGVTTRAALRDALTTLHAEHDERGLASVPQAVA
jgi:DNA-binding CsgD family transcriptional regulator